MQAVCSSLNSRAPCLGRKSACQQSWLGPLAMVSTATLACLQETEARKILQQLLDALDYCHRQGVFHRCELRPGGPPACALHVRRLCSSAVLLLSWLRMTLLASSAPWVGTNDITSGCVLCGVHAECLCQAQSPTFAVGH